MRADRTRARRARLVDIGLGGALVALGVAVAQVLGGPQADGATAEFQEITVRRLRVVDDRGGVRAVMEVRERDWRPREQADSLRERVDAGEENLREYLDGMRYAHVDDVLHVYGEDGEAALRLGASSLGGNVLVSRVEGEVAGMVWAGERGTGPRTRRSVGIGQRERRERRSPDPSRVVPARRPAPARADQCCAWVGDSVCQSR